MRAHRKCTRTYIRERTLPVLEVGRNYDVSRSFVLSPTQLDTVYRYYKTYVSIIIALHHHKLFSNVINSILWTKLILLLSLQCHLCQFPQLPFATSLFTSTHILLRFQQHRHWFALIVLIPTYSPKRMTYVQIPVVVSQICGGILASSDISIGTPPLTTVSLILLLFPRPSKNILLKSLLRSLLLLYELCRGWYSLGAVIVVISLAILLLPQRNWISSSSLVPPRASSYDPSSSTLKFVKADPPLVWLLLSSMLSLISFSSLWTYPSSSSPSPLFLLPSLLSSSFLSSCSPHCLIYPTLPPACHPLPHRNFFHACALCLILSLP